MYVCTYVGIRVFMCVCTCVFIFLRLCVQQTCLQESRHGLCRHSGSRYGASLREQPDAVFQARVAQQVGDQSQNRLQLRLRRIRERPRVSEAVRAVTTVCNRPIRSETAACTGSAPPRSLLAAPASMCTRGLSAHRGGGRGFEILTLAVETSVPGPASAQVLIVLEP